MPSTPPDDLASPDAVRQGPLAPSAVLARNTLWNLIGMLLPAAAAVVAIPVLIDQLGADRFGILTVAWVLTVLFALSDLGLARATTNLLSKSWGDASPHEEAGLIWGSLAAHVGLGMLAAASFAVLTPWLIADALAVPAELQVEARRAFYLLAASIPAVLAGNPLRSILEATQRFGPLNAVRLPMSILNYAGPLLLAPFTPRLEAIVGIIVATRVAGLVAYALLVWRVAPDMLRPTWPARATLRGLARTGGWLGATGFALPAVASLDRLVIGARLSMADAGYYSAPYEVVTKLWFLSGSLLIVLFPVFSALRDEDALRSVYWRAVRHLYVPAIAGASVILAFSTEAFTLWLGAEFGAAAAPVARWLAVGVAISVVGQVPMTLLQCRGRPDVPAIVHVIEVPAYAVAAWWAAGIAGITGVAMVWAGRAAIEAAWMFAAAGALVPAARLQQDTRSAIAMTVVGAAMLATSAWAAGLTSGWLVTKVLVIGCVVGAFLVWSWWRLLGAPRDLSAFTSHRKEGSSRA